MVEKLKAKVGTLSEIKKKCRFSSGVFLNIINIHMNLVLGSFLRPFIKGNFPSYNFPSGTSQMCN